MSDRSRTRPRRGIRGGGSVRRKRLAWINCNLEQGVQWDNIPVAHSGGQQCPLYSPAPWEPESSDDELDQIEYTQDPLIYSSRPLSQSLAWSQDLRVLQSHLHPHPGHLVQLRRVLLQRHLRSESLFRAAPKGEAASSSKGSATPKSTAASSSKGSVFVEPAAKSFSKGSARPKFPEKGSSSKGSAKSKSAEGSSSSKGSAYPRCIDTSYLQGVKYVLLV